MAACRTAPACSAKQHNPAWAVDCAIVAAIFMSHAWCKTARTLCMAKQIPRIHIELLGPPFCINQDAAGFEL